MKQQHHKYEYLRNWWMDR